MEFADGVAGLGVGGGRYGAGVQNNDRGGGGMGSGGIATIEELALDGGAVGLGRAAAELLDVEGGHFCARRLGAMQENVRSMDNPRIENRIARSVGCGKAVAWIRR